MIISVHVPKTAGTSFKQVLDIKFKNKILLDYDSSLSHLTIEEKRKTLISSSKKFNYIKRKHYHLTGVECIHGHFWPIKYVRFKKEKNVKFVTWLRDPIERIISHYYFWKRNPQVDPTNRIKRQMISEDWSLEKFCLSNELKNFYNKWFWKFPIENFDFIGITEYFEEDLDFFNSKYLGRLHLFFENNSFYPNTNTNPQKDDNYSSLIAKSLLLSFRDFHSKDYEIYNQALKIRKDRIKKF